VAVFFVLFHFKLYALFVAKRKRYIPCDSALLFIEFSMYSAKFTDINLYLKFF